MFFLCDFKEILIQGMGFYPIFCGLYVGRTRSLGGYTLHCIKNQEYKQKMI